LNWSGWREQICDNCWVPVNFCTTRPVGRPRTRWSDVVQKDVLQILGIRRWMRRAENRDEWRRLMRDTKARKGL